MTLPAQQDPVQPPAPSAKPDEPKLNENMVPQSRLNEMAEKNRQLQEKIEAVEKERQSQLEEQLKEQGKWKEVAEERAKKLAELQPKAEKLDSYEQTLQKILDREVEELPDDFKDVIPDGLSTQQKLDWLAKNKSKFMKADAFDIGAGKRGIKKNEKTAELTPEEIETAHSFGYTPEEYAKMKQ